MSDGLDENLYARVTEALKGCGAVSVSFIQMCFGTGFGTAAAILERMDREGLLPQGEMSGEERCRAEEKRRALLREGIRKRPSMLEFMPEQTPDICLAAVESDGMALRFVRHQTEDICKAAVKSNPEAARFIGRTPEMEA